MTEDIKVLNFPYGDLFQDYNPSNTSAGDMEASMVFQIQRLNWDNLDANLAEELMLWDRVSDYDLQYLEHIAEQLADEQG